MEDQAQSLPKTEQLPLVLRGLFERRGYRRYRMSNFESYDLYRENREFLESEAILTFTDPTGRLMALKPDVTMSIVKHTKPDTEISKLYYNEHVFRLAPQGGQYQEISQIGLEYIGGQNGYAEAETVELALRSLAAVGIQSVLNVGHMGFVTGLLEAVGLPPSARTAALEALRDKNIHALCAIAGENHLTQQQTAQLTALSALAGPFSDTLRAAGTLAVSPAMHTVLEELRALGDALHFAAAGCDLRLDFSTLNNTDYYNGIVFRGYVRGVPRAVLAGGRYDHLMRRFGKPQAAIGFALYLSELNRVLEEETAYDVDTLLLYSEEQTPAQVAAAVRTLCVQGSVFAAAAPPAGLRARRRVVLTGQADTTQTGGATC